MPPGGMCNFKVKLTNANQVDQELFDWIKHAHDSACSAGFRRDS